MFDQPSIEKLKREFTDKYVVVDGGRPELARFVGLTGQIKTVNMSGKALVQFDGRLNIGWYDIGLDFLKLVPKPEPKADEEKPAKKAAPAAKPEVAKPAAASAAGGEKKPSVLEQLKAQAAAKAGGAAPAAPAKEKPAAPAPEPVVEKQPDPKPAAAAPAGEKKKLSTAEILAALKKKP